MQKMIAGEAASMPAWETLERFARMQVQGFIQQLLEDEVAALLGRRKSERRTVVAGSPARAMDTGNRDSSRS